MDHDVSLAVESDWLPVGELRRLIEMSQVEAGGVSVAADGSSQRGVDPAIAAAVVSGVFGVLVPFVTRLVDRLFTAEPQATLRFTRSDGSGEVVIETALSPAERERLVNGALAAGAHHLRIGLQEPG